MKTLNIALVAHDGRKAELREWVRWNAASLLQHNLYATGTTASLLQGKHADAFNSDFITEYLNPAIAADYIKVNALLSGPLGGDQQIGAMIAEGKIDILIFFCDNLITQGHQHDVSALVRLASLYNVPFATNKSTADFIMTSPLFASEEYKPELPGVLKKYATRNLGIE